MNSDYVSIVGFVAATLTTASFLPQVMQTVKTRKTKDISLGMYIAFTIGITLWGFYGFLIQSAPIIIANVVTFVLTCIILYLKIKHG